MYSKLSAHHLKSTNASIESVDILSYITLAWLGNGESNGTTKEFILNLHNEVKLYERPVSTNDNFSDGQKCVLLEQTVHNISKLRQVINSADM